MRTPKSSGTREPSITISFTTMFSKLKSSQSSEERDKGDGKIQGPEPRRTKVSGYPDADNNSHSHPDDAIEHQPAGIAENPLEAGKLGCGFRRGICQTQPV